MTNKIVSPKLLAIAVLVVALLASTIWVFVGSATIAVPYLRVGLDVNPSIIININEDRTVDSVLAYNEDALALINGLDLEGQTIDVAANQIVSTMVANGYISETKNSVLLSVEGEDVSSTSAQAIVNEITTIVNNNAAHATVLVQEVKTDEAVKTLAEENGLSEGKVQLINEVTALDNTITFEDVKDLSVNDLNILMQEKNNGQSTIVQTGTPSTSVYISSEDAKALAISYAQINAASITSYEVEFDANNGLMTYEVELYTAEGKYEVDLNAVDGTLLKNDFDINETNDDLDDNDDVILNTVVLNKNTALQNAIADAGIDANAVTYSFVKLDENNDRFVYDVEFKTATGEWDYEIDAETGTIIDKDFDDESDDLNDDIDDLNDDLDDEMDDLNDDIDDLNDDIDDLDDEMDDVYDDLDDQDDNDDDDDDYDDYDDNDDQDDNDD